MLQYTYYTNYPDCFNSTSLGHNLQQTVLISVVSDKWEEPHSIHSSNLPETPFDRQYTGWTAEPRDLLDVEFKAHSGQHRRIPSRALKKEMRTILGVS